MIKQVLDSQQKNAAKLFTAALLILIFGVWIWYSYIFSNAERTFWATLDANLKSYGVTRNVNREANQVSEQQFLQLQLGAVNAVRDTITVSQSAGNQEVSSITSQTLASEDKKLSRYTKIETGSQTKQGLPVDFTSLLNRWSEEETDDQGGKRDLALAIAGPGYSLPFANLTPEKRQEVVEFAQTNKVYEINFNEVTRTQENGRSVYKYNVRTNQQAYIEMIKKLDAMLGLDQFQQVDATQYADQPPAELVISIDKNARQVVNIQYVAAGQSETLSGYGAQFIEEIPEPEFTREQLEQQIQSRLRE